MKRDFTVIPLAVIFAVAWVLSKVWDMPENISADHPQKFHILFWIMFISGVRISILWLQTLIHSVNRDDVDRTSWVLGHVFLGPISSLYYYFSQKPKTKEDTHNNSIQATPEGAPD